jgi:Flp pilus assembly protein CpaB
MTPNPRIPRLATRKSPPVSGNGHAPTLRNRQQAPPASPAHSGAKRALSPLPLIGVALIVLALIIDLGVLASSSNRTPVLVATHALPAGTVLSASDLRTGQIAGEPSIIGSLLPAGENQKVLGQRLSSAVPAGAPVPGGALAGSQSSSASLVLSVPEFDVTGSTLQPGDRVTVLATFGAGSGPATTRPVARNLQVLAVGEAGPNSNPSTSTVPVTVAVENSSIASSLALANEDAKIDLLLEGSASGSTAAIPSATQGSVP